MSKIRFVLNTTKGRVMSRKHFAALARALRAELESADTLDKWEGVVEAIVAIAGVCADFNSRFDRGRFYDACGLSEEKEW